MTPQATAAQVKRPIKINDLAIKVATVNGSGSISANDVLVRAIFKMGVPVAGKNLFPSNIQGLPTWFEIRANAEGWLARRDNPDLMICMNPASLDEDLQELAPGAFVVTTAELADKIARDDLRVLAVPFDELVVPVCTIVRLRRMVVNIMYVGVVSYLLGIETDALLQAIQSQFAGKAKAIELNQHAATVAYDWARDNASPFDNLRIERIEATRDKILIDGNTALALGAIWGGLTVLPWYPITPATSIAETAIKYMNKLRRDPQTGKALYADVQAEDELAAIGMVLGAGWAGARAMTTTSGPGISLMAEQVGLAYFAEIPAVLIDVQRMGPSTGVPTHPSQGDMIAAYYLSHGDCRHPMLIPGNIPECFEFACEAFNVAERFQTLVFVMSDLDMGMNAWLSDPFEQPAAPIDRGKVLSAEDLERIGDWGRYRDVDGDGIPYRTLPGNPHPRAAYFTRGTGHTDQSRYTEKPDIWAENLDRLARKFDTARAELPRPIVQTTDGASCGILAYGSSNQAVSESIHVLQAQHDLPCDYLRLRALPAHEDVFAFIERFNRVYVVEQNRDAQVLRILTTDRPDVCAGRLRPVLHYNGLTLDAASVVDRILALECASSGKEGSSP